MIKDGLSMRVVGERRGGEVKELRRVRGSADNLNISTPSPSSSFKY